MPPIALITMAALPLALFLMSQGHEEPDFEPSPQPRRHRRPSGERHLRPPSSDSSFDVIDADELGDSTEGEPPGAGEPVPPSLAGEMPSGLSEDTQVALLSASEELSSAGVYLPVPVAELTEEQVDDFVEEAREKNLADKAVAFLLAVGVPPSVIFLGRFALRYRWLFSPTIIDLLPQDWQDSFDRALASNWESDRELAVSFLVYLGLDRDFSERLYDGVVPPPPPEAFGFMDGGQRGPSLWVRGSRGSLEDEAAQGHVFSSVAPPGVGPWR